MFYNEINDLQFRYDVLLDVEKKFANKKPIGFLIQI